MWVQSHQPGVGHLAGCREWILAQESTFLLIKMEQQVSKPSTFSISKLLTGISR